MPNLKASDLKSFVDVISHFEFAAWVKPGPYRTYCGLTAQYFGEQLEALGIEYRILVSKQADNMWYTIRRADFEPGILDP